MCCQEQLERKAQYLRTMFDTFPIPAFILDSDIRLQDFNTAAESFVGPDPAAALGVLAGEAFHCLQSEGQDCGKSELCKSCVLRNGVTRALSGQRVRRELHEAQIRSRRGVSRVFLLVTASLLPYTEKLQALVVLEDVTEMVKLRRHRTHPPRKAKAE